MKFLTLYQTTNDSVLLIRLKFVHVHSQPLVKDCQFAVSPVNYLDLDSDIKLFKDVQLEKRFQSKLQPKKADY